MLNAESTDPLNPDPAPVELSRRSDVELVVFPGADGTWLLHGQDVDPDRPIEPDRLDSRRRSGRGRNEDGNRDSRDDNRDRGLRGDGDAA